MNNYPLPTTAVILAGGQGKRLKSIIKNIPKPMAKIRNKPFLEYLLNYWISQGIKKFILSVGYLADDIINYFGDKYKNAEIRYVVEERPLGTGGGLILCKKILPRDKPIIVLNGDTYFPINLQKLASQACKFKADWALALFRNNNQERYLVTKIDCNHKIYIGNDIPNKNQINLRRESFANGGIYWLKPDILSIFDFKKEFITLEKDILGYLKHKNFNLIGLDFKEPFIDIGVPKDYLKAQSFISEINQNE